MVWKNVSKKAKVVKVKEPKQLSERISIRKGGGITLAPGVVEFLGSPERVCVVVDEEEGLLGVVASDVGVNEDSVVAHYSKADAPSASVAAKYATVNVLKIDVSEGAVCADAVLDDDGYDAAHGDDEDEEMVKIAYILVAALEPIRKVKETDSS